MSKRKVLLLAGATAVGKSAVGVEVAERIDGEIVSADARQVYRGLDIGTAKPTRAEQRCVPHHLIDICEPDERYSAARFRQDATAAIDGIHRREKHALVVGGTGLYFRALTNGLFEAPEISTETKAQREKIESAEGVQGLAAYLEAHDRQTWEEIDRRNPARLRRAVEFHLETGESLSGTWRQTPGDPLAYQWIMIHLTRPRAVLHRRIEERVDQMLESGWIGEVERLAGRYDFALPAFNALGYRELQAFVEHSIALPEARQKIIERTRQYARRQLTWFRHQGPWKELPYKSQVSAKIALGLVKNAENKSA